MDDILRQLHQNKDTAYAAFQSKLIPTIDPATVIGVRTPVLRNIAKQFRNHAACGDFLRELPHVFFEENQLHGFLISEMDDFDRCITELEAFLPYMDNWATCDQTSPKVFRKHRSALMPYIQKWLKSDHVYTVRFAIGMLMKHFLDEDFKTEYLELVAQVRSEEYYINMEIAWYMATALAKQWDAARIYLETDRLDPWVHNKTIQKARESNRISKEKKEYLKSKRYLSLMPEKAFYGSDEK